MKKKLVILGAAAMVAAAAVPALAFENEFHGMYRLRANMTNFQAVGLSPLLSTDSTRDATVFEQRVRLQYIAKASDDLKLVTHFEIDNSWGDTGAGKATNAGGGNSSNGRGTGAGIGGDTVSLETKNIYIDFKIPSTAVNMKLGLMPFSDAYKGIFLSDDVAGAVASGKFGAVTTTAAFLRLMDTNTGVAASGTATAIAAGNGTTSPLGKQNVDVYVLDGKFALNKDTTLGASYYLLNNDENKSGQQTHSIGVNAAAKIGIVGLDGFFVYQLGDAIYDRKNATPSGQNKDLSAFAAQLAAKVDLGAVNLRLAALYATGNDGKDPNKTDAYQSVNGYVGQANSYYSSQMLILMRSVLAMDSDNAIVGSINNGDRGLVAGFLGADFKVNDKFNISANIGTANVDKRDMTNTAKNATTSSDIGTEVNLNLNYKLYPSLTATLQGAYAKLGGYTKAGTGTATGGDLKDPYLTGIMMNYVF